MMLLIFAITASFLRYGDSRDASEKINSEIRPRNKSTTKDSSYSRDLSRSKRLSRIEKLISEQFSKEQEASFYAYQDGMSLAYRERGLMVFYGQMRDALRGDGDSVAEIFTTYRIGEDEGYGFFINTLIENLGDDFFFQQIQRQPESIQFEILGHIWQTISRFPLDYQRDGSIPVADNGRYYPQTGDLFLELLNKELESEHWQKQKIKKANRVGGGFEPPPPTPPAIRIRSTAVPKRHVIK